MTCTNRTAPRRTAPRRPGPALLALAALAALNSAEAVKTVPYGLTFGMTRAQVNRVVPLASGTRGVYPAAAPTAGWADFRVTVSPTVGLCAITATSAPIPTNEQGANLLPLMEKLNLTLARAYGTPTNNAGTVPTAGLSAALRARPELLTTRYRTGEGIDVIVTAFTVKPVRTGDVLQAMMQLKFQRNYGTCTKDL